MIGDVTLSFDNGPTQGITEQILDVLRRQQVLSTFFVLGKNMESPELRALARRASEEGHWIGNHTYSHSVQLGNTQGVEVVRAELGRTQGLIGALSHPSRLFRPYGGGGELTNRLLSRDAVAYMHRERYTCVLWNAVPHDWDDPDGWVDTALAQCRATRWAVVVVHDIANGAMPHLESFIERAREEGARFRQEFPDHCKVMVEGYPEPTLEDYVAEAAP